MQIIIFLNYSKVFPVIERFWIWNCCFANSSKILVPVSYISVYLLSNGKRSCKRSVRLCCCCSSSLELPSSEFTWCLHDTAWAIQSNFLHRRLLFLLLSFLFFLLYSQHNVHQLHRGFFKVIGVISQRVLHNKFADGIILLTATR